MAQSPRKKPKPELLTEGSQDVDITRLSPGKNPRVFFPGIVELAELIRESEVVEPLTVLPNGEIQSGERRYRACILLNDQAKKNREEIPWPTLPVVVRDFDDKEAHDWSVQANLGRVDFRFIELARIFHTYREQYGLSNVEIAKKTGYAEETVSRYISILEKTHPDIIKRLDNGDEIPVDLLIKIHTIRDKEIQKLRLEQWLGNPAPETEAAPNRIRKAALSRRKLLALVKLLQEVEAEEQTIQVVQFIAGQRETLPHKWHLRLKPSRKAHQQAPE